MQYLMSVGYSWSIHHRHKRTVSGQQDTRVKIIVEAFCKLYIYILIIWEVCGTNSTIADTSFWRQLMRCSPSWGVPEGYIPITDSSHCQYKAQRISIAHFGLSYVQNVLFSFDASTKRGALLLHWPWLKYMTITVCGTLELGPNYQWPNGLEWVESVPLGG